MRQTIRATLGAAPVVALIGALVALVLVLPLSGMAAAQSQTAGDHRLLTVGGEGKVTAPPDMALITLGVVSEADAAKVALQSNSEAMNGIVAALKAEGIEARDLQTSGFSVDPVYSQPPQNDNNSASFKPEIVGYRVTNNLTLRIRDLTRVGPLLDKVVTLGANSISGPTFTVEDPAPLQDQARQAAVKDALRKAKLYAEAAGITLGPIFRIEEGYASSPQPLAAGAARFDLAAAPPPIEGGELSFDAQVTLSWTIE